MSAKPDSSLEAKRRAITAATSAFRAEVVKIMPGYEWVVNKTTSDEHIQATGAQSSGFNRLSTLAVSRYDRDGEVIYIAKSAGYGLRAKWLHESSGATLAQALRSLQEHYEGRAATYRNHALAMQQGRKATGAKQ